jgi:hypothetical protein
MRRGSGKHPGCVVGERLSEVELHQLLQDFAQPELSGPERSYGFKVEQWDRPGDHIIWLIAVYEPQPVADPVVRGDLVARLDSQAVHALTHAQAAQR